MIHIFAAQPASGKTLLANSLKKAGCKHVYDGGYPMEKPADFPEDITDTPVFIFKQEGEDGVPDWLCEIVHREHMKLSIRGFSVGIFQPAAAG